MVMTNSCINDTAVLSEEETVAIFLTIASYLGTPDFKITSVSSPDGKYVYKTDEVILN